MRWTTVLLTLVIAAMGAGMVGAEVPHTLNYQGFVAEILGQPLDGNYAMEFRLYESEQGGSSAWHETHASVEVDHGVFSVVLGKSDSLNLPFDVQTYWLGVTIDGFELHPYKEFTSVLYALRSAESDYALVAAVAESLVNGLVRCDDLRVTDDVRVDDEIYIYPPDGPVPFAGWTLYVSGDTRLHGSLSFDFDYDSLWYSIDPGHTVVLSHSLGGDPSDYVVLLHGRSSSGGIHQANFGSCSYRSGVVNKWLGCEWWGMTNGLIRVTRADDDDEASSDRDWNEFRIRIIKNGSTPGFGLGGGAHELSAPRR